MERVAPDAKSCENMALDSRTSLVQVCGIGPEGEAMDKLVTGLGPAFAAGFAVQRLPDIFDGVLNLVPGGVNVKKVVTALISFLIGLLLAGFAGLRVLKPLGLSGTSRAVAVVDVIVTALVLSAGTEGFNSILKFLGYAKDDKKAQAATSLHAVTQEPAAATLRELNPPPKGSAAALPATPG